MMDYDDTDGGGIVALLLALWVVGILIGWLARGAA